MLCSSLIMTVFLSSVPAAEASHGARVTDLLLTSAFSHLKYAHASTLCAVFNDSFEFLRPSSVFVWFLFCPSFSEIPYLISSLIFAFLFPGLPLSRRTLQSAETFRCGNRPIQGVILHLLPFSCVSVFV